MWERIRSFCGRSSSRRCASRACGVLLFVPPMVQLLVFGFAVNLDVDHTRIAWMDMDRTPLSRELRARFEGSGRFDVVVEPASEEDVQRTLDRGEAQAVVRVLPGFERDVLRGPPDGSAGAGRRHELEYGVAGVELCGVDHRGVLGAMCWRSGRTCRLLARSPGGSGERGGAAGDGARRASGSIPTSTAGTTSSRA